MDFEPEVSFMSVACCANCYYGYRYQNIQICKNSKVIDFLQNKAPGFFAQIIRLDGIKYVCLFDGKACNFYKESPLKLENKSGLENIDSNNEIALNNIIQAEATRLRKFFLCIYTKTV